MALILKNSQNAADAQNPALGSGINVAGYKSIKILVNVTNSGIAQITMLDGSAEINGYCNIVTKKVTGQSSFIISVANVSDLNVKVDSLSAGSAVTVVAVPANNELQNSLNEINSADGNMQVAFDADAANGKITSGRYTVSTNVVSISLPDTAKGFKIYPVTNDIRFAINENPAAVGTDALTVGAIAKSDQWETRLLQSGASRTLRLLGTSSTVVDVELF